MSDPVPYTAWPGYFDRPKNIREARKRLEELLSLEADRVSRLLTSIGLDPKNLARELPADLYRRAAERLCALLVAGPYSSPGMGPRTVQLPPGPATVDPGPVLTEVGEALAADLSLLFARALMDGNEGRLRWGVVEGPRSDVSFLLPAIHGFGRMHCDPVLVVTTIATGVVRGSRDCSEFAAALESWLDLVPRDRPT